MKFFRFSLPLMGLGLPLLALSGCVVPLNDPVYSTCRGTSAGDWNARVDLEPRWRGGDPKKRVLVVTGKVNVPEGVDVSLDLGPREKFAGPIQQVLVRTVGQAAPGAPLVVRRVQGRFAQVKSFKTVRIRCGDANFAELDSIVEAPAAAS
jgi:hypothetical protein